MLPAATMLSILAPARPCIRQGIHHAERQFCVSPGLQLRMNIRSFTRQSAKQQATQPRDSIALAVSRDNVEKRAAGARMLALLGGAGLALYATSSYSVALESDSLFGSRPGNTANLDGFSLNDASDGFGGNGEFPKSEVNVYNLGFGSVCGVCAGVFIKKGLKLIAFVLGGGFILLQYLNSQRIVNVNWRQLANRYDSTVASAAGEDLVEVNKRNAGGWSNSTAARIWNRFVHFLTADFPSRGTFLAGLLLGLRLG